MPRAKMGSTAYYLRIANDIVKTWRLQDVFSPLTVFNAMRLSVLIVN